MISESLASPLLRQTHAPCPLTLDAKMEKTFWGNKTQTDNASDGKKERYLY